MQKPIQLLMNEDRRFLIAVTNNYDHEKSSLKLLNISVFTERPKSYSFNPVKIYDSIVSDMFKNI